MTSSLHSPIIFLRHGETPWNALGRYQGATDIQLSKAGENQADTNGQLINKFLDLGTIDRNQVKVVSSPLLRAFDTATIIAGTIDKTDGIKVDSRFKELSMGHWEGLNSQQVKTQFYEERKSRKTNRWDFKPLNGESMAERQGGIQAALHDLKPHTIVVTHSVVLRVILHLIGGMTKDAAAQKAIPHLGCYCWDGAELHRQN